MSTLRDKLIRLETVQDDRQRAMQGLAEALKDANGALERVSAHFQKIRPEHLEPSAMMNHVDSVLVNNRAALAAARPFLTGT